MVKMMKRAIELSEHDVFAKGLAEEEMQFNQLNQLALARFGRMYSDLNEAEKDEIYNMCNGPFQAQPPIKHSPQVPESQPKGQDVSETQEVLKTGPLEAPKVRHQETVNQIQPAGQKVNETQEVLKSLDEHASKIIKFLQDNKNPSDESVHAFATQLGLDASAVEADFYKIASIAANLKHGTDPDEKFDPEQLKMGIDIEKEHVDEEDIAKMIAKAHLAEFSNYYTYLKKMEDEMKNLNKSTHYMEKPGMGHSEKWWDIYHALRQEGYSKERAAKIANSKEKTADKEAKKDEIKSSNVMVHPEMTKPDPLTKAFNISQTETLSPASEKPELAERYNELVDKANGTVEIHETTTGFMNKDNEREDVFASHSKGGKEVWIQ